MSDKSLREKAIDIKGKKYVIVSDRVLFFNEAYPYASLTTEMLSAPDAETVIFKATASPDGKRFFSGHSQATWDDGYINKTSALENAETSAVGRALGMMGIGVIDSIASLDEINKAETHSKIQQAEKRFDDARISPANVREFWKEARKTGHSNDQVAAYLANLGHKQTEEIKQSEYDSAMRWAKTPIPVPQDLAPPLQAAVAMIKAKKVPKEPTAPADKPKRDLAKLFAVADEVGVPEADFRIRAKERYGAEHLSTDLSDEDYKGLIEWVKEVGVVSQ